MYFFLACDCNPDGSVNHLCDDNGKCTCNEHVVGDKCDSCATGYGDFFACDQCIDEYHGYPNCIGKILLSYSVKFDVPNIITLVTINHNRMYLQYEWFNWQYLWFYNWRMSM